MTTQWQGSGPEYTIEWGGRPWRLKVDDPAPGLRPVDPARAGVVLLGLAGVAARGRSAPTALGGATLREHACRLGRVEALYAPLGWGELTVRACWSPSTSDGIDLEIQASARSVGELTAVEVFVASTMSGPPGEGGRRFVEPRDARAAALSYDGREPDLSGLSTLPPRAARPSLSRTSSRPATAVPRYYAEMAHPLDVSRRLTWGGGARRFVRYALFGHDLERGVVVRGRLRGVWLPDEKPAEAMRAEFRRFLDEPPPLGA